MKTPRWTVYPALAVLAVFLLPAIPRKRAAAPVWPGPSAVRGEASNALSTPSASSTSTASASSAPASASSSMAVAAATTSPSNASSSAAHKRIVVLGIDGMDPDLLREAIGRDPKGMKNFARLARENGIHELGTSTPPQSPVAWSNFITGMDPGGHGIFDFIHRDPMTRIPAPSTVKSSDPKTFHLWSDWKLALGGSSEPNRSGKAFWTLLAERGIPADVWRMPANFPAEPAEGWSFSGMMTPAIDSAYGACTLYSSDPPVTSFVDAEEKIISVREYTPGVIETFIQGRENDFKSNGEHVNAPMRIFVDREANAIAIELGDERLVLPVGKWSTFLHPRFEPLPGGLASYSGIVRFYLRRVDPVFELYASPVNIDPASPVAPVSEPGDASAFVVQEMGPFYTQGMPEDVNALKHGVLNDAEFLAQADLVHDEGVQMLDLALDRWLDKKDGGFLFFYFSGVDLCGHMMWKHHDEKHPAHDAVFASKDSSAWSKREGSTWKDVVFDLYLRMDPVLGRLRERIGESALLFVMSDHGFASWRREFSLNTWLYENGYLVLKDGFTKERSEKDPAHQHVTIYRAIDPTTSVPYCAVDWSRTRAYGVGFNGLYVNLKGREQDDPSTDEDESGIVNPGAEADALVDEIKKKLEGLNDRGERVVVRCDRARDVFHGKRAAEAPDLVVGYNAGYGNSDASTLGRIPNVVFVDNLGGTFNGNHLMSPDVVPGLLMTTGALEKRAHRLEDLTFEILRQYGVAPGPGMTGSAVLR